MDSIHFQTRSVQRRLQEKISEILLWLFAGCRNRSGFEGVQEHIFHVMEGAGVEALLDERFDFRLMDDYAQGWLLSGLSIWKLEVGVNCEPKLEWLWIGVRRLQCFCQ